MIERLCETSVEVMEEVCSVTRSAELTLPLQEGLEGCSDVSESAEALIRTRVNHCSENPGEGEAAWGDVSQESGRPHRRMPVTL